MVDCYVGEIRAFAGKRTPRGWALCDGTKLPIADYEALFNLLGTTWGGDGRSDFALPDLRGRLLVGSGQGKDLRMRNLGETGGEEQVTITLGQLPPHTHPLTATNEAALTNEPGEGVTFATATSPDADPSRGGLPYIRNMEGIKTDKNKLKNDTLGNQTNSAPQPHSNLMPTLSINYIIALYGIYPSN